MARRAGGLLLRLRSTMPAPAPSCLWLLRAGRAIGITGPWTRTPPPSTAQCPASRSSRSTRSAMRAMSCSRTARCTLNVSHSRAAHRGQRSPSAAMCGASRLAPSSVAAVGGDHRLVDHPVRVAQVAERRRAARRWCRCRRRGGRSASAGRTTCRRRRVRRSALPALWPRRSRASAAGRSACSAAIMPRLDAATNRKRGDLDASARASNCACVAR